MLKFIFLVRDQKFYFGLSKDAEGLIKMTHDDLAIQHNLRPPSGIEYFNEIFYPFASLGVEQNNLSPILIRSAELDINNNVSYTIEFSTAVSDVSTDVPPWQDTQISLSSISEVLMRDLSKYLGRTGPLWLPVYNDRYPNVDMMWIDFTGQTENVRTACWYD